MAKVSFDATELDVGRGAVRLVASRDGGLLSHKELYHDLKTGNLEVLAALDAAVLAASQKVAPGRAGSRAKAVYFESTPVSRQTAASSVWQCVILPAPTLDGIDQDADTFAMHFSAASAKAEEKSDFAMFENLGGDAVLVAPMPAPLADASHLAAWLASSPPESRYAVWQGLAAAVETTLSKFKPNQPLWVSTSGAGVSWLHFRLDSKPKYYVHKPFTAWPQ